MGKGGNRRSEFLKAKGKNQSRPVRHFIRNPPQISGKLCLCPAGAAMNFIVNVRLQAKKKPLPQ